MGIMDLLEDLPWSELRRSFDARVAGGAPRREAARMVAQVVDRMVDWTELVPGAAGVALEAADGPLVQAAITLGLLHSRRGA